MPTRHKYYDPQIEEPPIEQKEKTGMALEGISIPAAGVWLPLDGVIEYLREAARQWDEDGNPSGALALRAVADVLSEASPSPETGTGETIGPLGWRDDVRQQLEGNTLPDVLAEAPAESKADQVAVSEVIGVSTASYSESAVDRVEVYPDNPDDMRPRWHARAVDNTGKIIYVTAGSFDQDYVIKNATEKWPEVDIHLVHDSFVDTVWDEKPGIRSASSGMRPPSPKRLFPNS